VVLYSGKSYGDYTTSQESEIVADPDTATGFRVNRAHGLRRFKGGRFYRLVMEKAEPLGDPENIALHFDESEKYGLITFIIMNRTILI